MKKIIGLLLILVSPILSAAEEFKGYYRFPSLHGKQLIFTAEGDLWSVHKDGGLASRLTSNHGEETHGTISPDGQWIAFTAEYEGPKEVYLMPARGGVPTRLTYFGGSALVRGWTPDGHIIFASSANYPQGLQQQLYLIHPESREPAVIPLAQASDGVYDSSGHLFFVRQTGRPDYTKAYQGGAAQTIWRFKNGSEATPVTKGYPGTSKHPMLWQDRLYFVSDRSDNRIFNLWSVDSEGKDHKQHTFEDQFDLFSPSLYEDSVVYQSGADLKLLDLTSGKSRILEIYLKSDFEQRRPYALNSPMDYLSSFNLSDDGQRLALTARGQITTFPTDKGRIISVRPAVESLFYSTVRFLPDSNDLIAVGEKEKSHSIWHIPAYGNASKLLHETKASIEYGPVISPDGQWLAWSDSELTLYLTSTETGKTKTLFRGERGDYPPQNMNWSPDSQWLVFVYEAQNLNQQIYIADITTNKVQPITSDRVNSYNPVWSACGQWLAFISDRYFQSQVSHPFTHNQQEPYSTNNAGIFALAMTTDAQWPYTEANELDYQKTDEQSETETSDEVRLNIALEGLEKRLYRFPLPPGQYYYTGLGHNTLFWQEPSASGLWNLKGLSLLSQKAEPYTVLENILFYKVDQNRQALTVFKDHQMYYLPTSFRDEPLEDYLVDTSHWRLNINPAQEWQHIFNQAWKYYDNYFYDRGLNQVDWNARLNQFKPLLKRITDRNELNDVLRQMVSVVGVLHLQLGGGDTRSNHLWEESSWLGAKLDKKPEGYQVKYIYKNDPDYPQERSPLSQPGVDIQEGDVITAINNQPLTAFPLHELLLNQNGQQVLVDYVRSENKDAGKAIIYPINSRERKALIYRDSFEAKRHRTEQLGQGRIGYIHLTALDAEEFAQWVRQFYPVFNKEGLILDLRNNLGGNIDSWILSRLMRKVVYFESQRNKTTNNWGMPYAFQGHIAVLINENTMSDAEVLAQSLRELKLAPLIGTRTWGGRVWRINMELIDHGFLSVPVKAHFNPQMQWASESHGIKPDIEIDNLPYETFSGKDAQLDAAIEHLLDQIRKQPVSLPDPPSGSVIPTQP